MFKNFKKNVLRYIGSILYNYSIPLDDKISSAISDKDNMLDHSYELLDDAYTVKVEMVYEDFVIRVYECFSIPYIRGYDIKIVGVDIKGDVIMRMWGYKGVGKSSYKYRVSSNTVMSIYELYQDVCKGYAA